MELRHCQYHHPHQLGMDKSTVYSNYRGRRLPANCTAIRYQTKNSSSPVLPSPDVIEKDSRSGGGVRYPPSMYDSSRPVFLSRSPVMDNEKDMTRTSTTPRSPAAPTASSPVSSDHELKMTQQSGGVLSRGAHLASHRGTSSQTTTSSTSVSSLSSEPGRHGHGGNGPQPQQTRLNYPPGGGGGGGGTGMDMGGGGSGRMGMGRYQNYQDYSSSSSFHHYGHHVMVGGGGGGGVPLHNSDHNYRTGHQYNPRYRLPPSMLPSAVGGGASVAGMYHQPSQAYSTYPSESYGNVYQGNHSRPLSTGSLSSVSTASSRPGFSSLDEFPTMYDHRSTFAPGDEVLQHRRYGGSGGGVAPPNPNPNPYLRLHDDHAPSSSSYSVGACVGSPLSPPSLYDDHQPLLSLQQQGALLEDFTSDELAGQLTNEMSRTLTLQDQRTVDPLSTEMSDRNQLAGTRLDDREASNCIDISEHPKDIEVSPNERAVLRCTARIINGHSHAEKEVELKEGREKEEPNLLWFKDAEPLIGEIDCEYVVEEVTEKDVGLYYCLVTHPENERLQRQSNVARLTIKKKIEGHHGNSQSTEEVRSRSSAPEIVEQPPKDLSAVVDEQLQISLKAAGQHLSFRWYKDNKEMRYADGPVLHISSARYSDSGVYCCSISNEFGSILCQNCLVKVTHVRDSSAVSGFKRPSSIYNWDDQPFTDAFLRDVGMAVARQTSDLKRIALYLGLRNADIVEINRHFHIPEEQAFHMLRLWSKRQQRDRSMLKIILTKAGIKLDLLASGTTKKPAAGKPPTISLHPKSTQVVYGRSLSLSIQLESSEPAFNVQYQWYRNGKPLGGKTSADITVSSATEGDIGEYFCVVSNQSGQTASKVAKVEVINPHSNLGSSMRPSVPAQTTSSAFVTPSSLGGNGGYHQTRWAHEDQFRGTTVTSTNTSATAAMAAGKGPAAQPHLGRHVNRPQVGGDFLSRGATSVVTGGRATLVGLETQQVEGQDEDDQPGGQPVMGRGKRPTDMESREKGDVVVLSSQQRSSSTTTGTTTRTHSEKALLRIVEHPKSQQVEAGDPLTLNCTAVGGHGQLSYTWYFNGLSLAGENRPQYEINCFTDEDEGLYQCKVQSAHEQVLSKMAHIEMKDDPSD